MAAPGARGVRLRVDDRWVVTVPLDRCAVHPVLADGSLGAPLDGVSAPVPGPLVVLDAEGTPVATAAAAGLAEPDTALDPAEVGALPPALAGLLAACGAYAAAARGRALLAAAHRGLAADLAAARRPAPADLPGPGDTPARDVPSARRPAPADLPDLDVAAAARDVAVWRTVHAAQVHAGGLPGPVPDWLALQPSDAAVAWRAGAFGHSPAAAPGPPDTGPSPRPATASDPLLSRDPAEVRARAAAQQGHGYAKPALSVGLTVAMALALTGCGGDPDDNERAVADDEAVCIDRDTQEVLADEFCDDDGPRAYPGGFALLVFGGSFYTGPGGRRYVRNYSPSRPRIGGRPGGGVFGGGSRGTGGG